MAYTKNYPEWAPGMEITATRMNHIEDGIAEVAAKADGAATLGDLSQAVSDINNIIGGGFSSSDTITLKVNNLTQTTADLTTAIELNTGNGNKAWTQIVGVQGVSVDGEGNIILNKGLNDALNARFNQYPLTNQIITPAVLTPTSTDKIVINGEEVAVDTLARRILHIYNRINANSNDISHAKDLLNNDFGGLTERLSDLSTTVSNFMDSAGGTTGLTVAARLSALDGGNINEPEDLPERNIKLINTEIIEARSSHTFRTDLNIDVDYNTLDERFEADEGRIKALQTEINATHLGSTAPTLSDRLNNIDGGGKPDKTLPQVITEITAAHRTTTDTLDDRFDAIDDTTINNSMISRLTTLEGNFSTSANDLDNRLDNVEATLNTTNTGLTDRVSALETEVDMTSANSRIDLVENEVTNARTSSVVRTPGANDGDPDTDTTYGSLDARLEAIETAAIVAKTNIDTIAGELAMVNNGTIVNTNTKIDRLEADIQAFATELDMARDLTGALIDTNTRVDLIAYDISHTATQNDNTTGLTQRISAVEEAINDTNGIIDRLDAIDDNTNGAIKALLDVDISLDARLDAIDGGTALTGTTLGQRVSTIESDLNTENTGLKARVITLENEPKSATVVIDNTHITYNNGQPTSIGETPSEDKDYLLLGAVPDDKYYYWKYLGVAPNGTWNLISGAGGNGNTSGVNLTRAEYNDITNKAENTDYYVLESDGLRHHYRWIPGENDTLVQIEIGQFVDTTQIKKYNIFRVTGTKELDGGGSEEVEYLNLYQYDYNEDNSIIDTQRPYFARVELPKGGGTASNTVNNLIRIGNQTTETIVGSTVKLRVFYSSWDGPQSNDGTYVLKAGSTTIETGIVHSGAKDEEITGWKSNTDGYYEFDVSKYCKIGSTSFTLTVTVNGTPLGKSWSIDMKDLRIETNAPSTLLINSTDSYQFSYTPFGALTKILHVLIDGTQVGTLSLVAGTSGRETSYTITPAMILQASEKIHGAHTIEMYLTANIGGSDKQTDSIIRQYIWYDATDTEDPVIIASQYSELTIEATLYSTVIIPYQVYKKDATTIEVKYYLDEAETPFDLVTLDGTNIGELSYLAFDTGAHTLTIAVDNESIEINLSVSAIEGVDVSPVDGAIIDFDPITLTNSSANRLPTWETTKGTFSLTASDNFNWSEDINGGGYKQDEDGKCFVIKAGSYVDLDYKMFERRSENGIMTNVLDRGAEIKVIFKTKAVRNADAIWFSNTGSYNDKTVGIQLGAHVGWLKTDKAADTSVEAIETEDTITINNTVYNKWKPNTLYTIDTIVIANDEDGNAIIYKCKEEHTSEEEFTDDNWQKMGAADTETLSTNSYLYLPYSENDKIELDININKYTSGATNNFIMSYEDGVPSKAYAYTYGVSGDGLVNNSGIRIGSPDCDVYLYHLRIYNNALDTDKILLNFIADGKDIDEKIARYNRNCIYWDPTLNDGKGAYFTSPSGTASLDPVKLAERIPDVKILMLDTPVFTVGKKNFVKNSTLRCIHAHGGKVYESRGDADNWFFQGGFHAGQGTTSDNYGQSSRNVDFLFEVDGTHWPTKAKNMKGFSNPPDYKSSVLIGENATKWDEDNETWVPTSIYDSENEEWVPNEDILSAEEIQNWTAKTPDYCNDWKGDHCKVSLTSTSIPNNYFNLKVNVASSENVNNALFLERFNEFLNSIYESPAYKRDHKIKNDMEFVPAILFIRENQVDDQGNPKGHTEFNDCNWHFYALGNIGDSKKSDYTRAYNPYDMGEFTVENSDNNTNNGQFRSGVFMYNGIYAVETDYAEWNNHTAYEQNAIVTKEGKMYQRSGESMAALGENETASWVAADWTDITPTTTKTIYYAPRTNPNPMEYLYGIDPEEWNTKMTVPDSAGVYHYINRKHDKLVTEKFDGDHSFEFRYACLGDYRDGDLINDTTGLAKSQEKTNQNIVFNFYEWLMTATDEEFAAEATNWFVPTAMEFFYAFTHYYTMMDNRAKNTFWHWGKRYISTNDANGVNYTAANTAAETAQAAYDEAASNLAAIEEVLNPIIAQAEADIASADATLQNDPEDEEALATKAQATADKEAAEALIAAAEATKSTAKSQLTVRAIKRDELKFLYDHADCFIVDNAEAAINEGRRFDLWAYDMDTAAGIDNNGALVFPYGKEDEDYRVKGEASSGYAFNGAGSIFWRRLKTTFADDIVTVMNNVDVDCFNSENLIEQFDRFLSCFPEEIWRLDIERKYIRTFTGASVDNSVTTGKLNPRFLTSMMQGRKKYQRRQWIRDLGVYFNSKYRLTDIIRNENTIEFNIITPTNSSSLALQPSYNLQLTPYQDMYLNVTIGNGGPTPQIRAEAGKTYTLDLLPYSSGTFAETRLYIYGFNHISGIGNLAPMYPYSFTLSALEHLKVLDLGTDVTGYSNANFTVLPFSETTQLPLLETLNVKNCNYLAGSISLDTANNLRVVEAAGTAITGISLPDYTNIEVLHLPSSVSALELYGARFLKDFQMINNLGQIDYSGLYTLHVYDSDYSANYIWQTETPYAVDDIVMIDNNLYKCKLEHTSVDHYDKDDPGIWATYLADNWTLIRSNINLPVDWMSIAVDMIEKESAETSLSLQKLSSATIDDVQVLMPFNSLKAIAEAAGGLITFSGTITITGSWSKVETKVYTNNVGYYTEENGTQVWNRVLTAMEENDAPAWPELKLIIDPAKELIKWPVTYRYNDTSKVLYINDGTAAPEIYLEDGSGLLTTMPTKASTPQFNYMFGSRDDLQGHYIPYSGWKLSTSTIALTGAPIIYGPTILDAFFVGIKRLYYIRWYVEPGKLVRTSRAEDYGGGYTLENPTIKDIHNAGFETCHVSVDNTGMVTYGIFTDWNKLPINIDPDGRNNYFDIYGVWDDNNGQAISIGDLFANTNNLTPVQLLVLSQLTDDQKSTYGIDNNIDISTCMTYQLGQDNSTAKYNGHVIQSDAATPFYLNGSNTQIYTTYLPLLASQDAFTFAIDYALNETTYTSGKNYAIIASCYHSANGVRNGFGIFKNISSGAIEVGFGDMYRYASLRVTITNSTNSTMRNIVVLRHPKNSPTLYIYSGLSNDQSIPLEEPYYNYITRSGETEFNSDAYLNIGALISTSETIDSADSVRNSWTRAVGTVYWAKYWEEDLGIGECKRIAAWPHEQLTLGIAYSLKDPNAEPNSRRAQEDTIPNPTLYLATRNTLAHGLIVQDRKNSSSFIDNHYSWENSTVRTLCNNRMLFGLPTALQSILCKASVETYPIEYYDGGNEGNGYRIPNYTIITRDYLYAYSAANLLPDHSNYENEDLTLSPFAWRIPTNVQVYLYNSSNYSWNVSQYNPLADDGRGTYFNIRFPYVNAFIGTTLRVFKTDSGTGISNIAESIGTDVLRNGDIYIEGSTAYIYVSNSEINTYGLSGILYKDTTRFNGISDSSVINIGGGAGKGGWIRAEDYWTRSLILNGTQWTIFAEVNQDGNINLDTISSNSTGYKVNYILAI